MEDELLRKLIEFIEQASPVIWGIVRRRVAVELVQSIIWLVVCVVGTYLLARLCKNRWEAYKENTYSDSDISATLSGVAAAILGVAIPIILTNVVSLALNPDYYAIRLLLGFVK